MKIIEDIIQIKGKVRPGIKRKKKWIVVHETGNYSKGANAKGHSHYLKGLANSNTTYVSWHYTVDDTCAYHHIPDDEIAYHASDGTKEGGGNMAGIGIEICVNSDGNFEKAMDNAAWLIAKLLKDHKLTVNNVKQHYDFAPNKKNCPETIRNKGLWNNFLKKVEKQLGTEKPVKQLYRIRLTWNNAKSQIGAYYNLDAAKKACKSGYSVFDESGKVVYQNIIHFPKTTYNGVSILEALKSIGVNNSFAYRSKIAIKNGIDNYTGTAQQNAQMLNLLKQGKLLKP